MSLFFVLFALSVLQGLGLREIRRRKAPQPFRLLLEEENQMTDSPRRNQSRVAAAIAAVMVLCAVQVSTAAAQESQPEAAVRYQPAPRVPAHNHERQRPWVGGHVNFALPLVEFRPGPGRSVLAIGRDFGTLGLAPGITVHLNHRWAVDFEFVAYSDWKNDITSVVFDPGVWYKFDKITLGLRTAVHIGQPPNWGLIPILIKGWPVGLVNLFVEFDLPMFVTDRDREGGVTTFSLTFQPQFGVSF